MELGIFLMFGIASFVIGSVVVSLLIEFCLKRGRMPSGMVKYFSSYKLKAKPMKLWGRK